MSRQMFDKATVFSECEQMGEAAVIADLERLGVMFQSVTQKGLAWEWVYSQKIARERATERSLKFTATLTFYVAIGTFLVALFTAALAYTEYKVNVGEKPAPSATRTG